MTPLLYAIKTGNNDAARYFLSYKDTDINKANNNGQTPLFYAAYSGNTTIAKDLLELGADYNKADNKGITPLAAAQKRGNKETARAINDFILVKNLPKDSKGNSIVQGKNTVSAPSEKAMAVQMAQQKAQKQQEQLIKDAKTQQEKALAQTQAMQDQVQKALAFADEKEKEAAN